MEAQGLLFVDASYLIFYAYYATLKFHSNIATLAKAADVIESPLFTTRFASLVRRKVFGVAAAHNIPASNIVIARDCERSSVWRRDICPKYKGTRAHKADFNARVFDFAFSTVFPRMQAERGVRIVAASRAEADDVVGVAHAHLRDTAPDTPIVVITNDSDYIQLADERTTIVNLAGEDITHRKSPHMDAAQYLTCRVLSGDRADNIPGAMPRCGMKTAESIVLAPGVLDGMLADNPRMRAKFDLNQQMMNMQQVPDNIKEEIIVKIRSFFNFKDDACAWHGR